MSPAAAAAHLDDMSAQTRTVYRKIGTVTETCSHGCEHEVTYLEVKRLTDTGQTRIHDNGYEQRATPLLTDAQGRTYHQHVTIDFTNNVSYARDEDGVRFTPRLSSGPARDLLGRPLNGTTPPGPAWDWRRHHCR